VPVACYEFKALRLKERVCVCVCVCVGGRERERKRERNWEDLQDIMDHHYSACNNFGLTISTKKKEVLYQPAPGKPYTEPTIFVNGQKLSSNLICNFVWYLINHFLCLETQHSLPLTAWSLTIAKTKITHELFYCFGGLPGFPCMF